MLVSPFTSRQVPKALPSGASDSGNDVPATTTATSAGDAALHEAGQDGPQAHVPASAATDATIVGPTDTRALDELLPPTLSPQVRTLREANLHGARRLEEAVVSGSRTRVKAVLDDFPRLLNAPLTGGYTALHFAVYTGSTRLVAFLLEQPDIEVNPLSVDGFTPLQLAIHSGRNDVALQLLEDPDTDVHAQLEDGSTSFLLAIERNALGVAERLLALGADINQAKEDGTTPLHVAVTQQHEDAVAALLSQPDIAPNQVDHRGMAPLHVAAQTGSKTLAKRLLDHDGIDVNVSKPPHHVTAFHAALLSNKRHMAALLRDHGANINASLSNGYTPLHNACADGDLKLVQWLMTASATKGHALALLNPVAQDGSTALQLAVRGGHADVVQYLLKNKAIDPNTKDKDGWAPLHDAFLAGHAEIAEMLLLAPQTDPGLAGRDGLTPLHLVAMSPNPLPLIKLFRKTLSERDALHAPPPSHAAPPSTRLNALIDVPPSAPKTDSFKALTDLVDRWGARPVSLAAQRGKGNDVIFELLPPEMAKPRQLHATTHDRAWLITGPKLEGFERRHLAALGVEVGIDMHSYGDGKKQALTWKGLNELPVGPGDVVVLQCHAMWNERLQRIMIELGDGEEAPLEDVARMFYEKGVLKMLLLGCEVSLAAGSMVNRFRSDPSIPRPADRDGGYQGLDITVLGGGGSTLGKLNLDATQLFIQDCGSQRASGQPGTALRTQSVQAQLTVGWDSAQRQLGTHWRAELKVEQLDPALSADQVKAIKENLLLMHVNDNKLDEVKKLLTQHDVSATTQLDFGASALTLASENGHAAMAELLLEHGADMHQADEDGDFPLYSAAVAGHKAVVELLLNRGAKVNQATFAALDTQTPLHGASDTGKADVVAMLLEKGANALAENANEHTALDIALLAGHTKVAQTLRDHLAKSTHVRSV